MTVFTVTEGYSRTKQFLQKREILKPKMFTLTERANFLFVIIVLLCEYSTFPLHTRTCLWLFEIGAL